MSLTTDQPPSFACHIPNPAADLPRLQGTCWPAAPLADALLTLASRDLTSFHALPISHGNSLNESALAGRYAALFGTAQLGAEVSYSGSMLDSYFDPQGPLHQAQGLAAEAFGADHTFFISTGTSTANRVALGALTTPGDRVLADRSCHQSVHFVLHGLSAAVDYSPLRVCCERCGREFADLPAMIEMYAAAVREGRPYRTVVLSATSYDGIRYDLPAVLGALVEIQPDVRVVVDEAWGAAHNFHRQLRPLTALAAWDALRRTTAVNGRFALAVTHSAHKSLSALRQGSYLHYIGSDGARERVSQELFQQHTTSPSWPVLASLDLARAQAVSEGEQLLQRSIALAEAVREEITTDPRLSAYGIVEHDPAMSGLLVHDDVLRLLVSLRGLEISSADFRRRLFEEHGLYIARDSGGSVLLHFHIGVTRQAVDRLLDAMRTLQRIHQPRPARHETRSDQFVIAYPPGIPIALPGENLDDARKRKIETLRATGSEIYTLPSRCPNDGR